MAPTPRPRTLAGSKRVWDGPQALPGVAIEAVRPRNSSVAEKEVAALKTLGSGVHSPEDGEARAPYPRGPPLDGTQESSTTEVHPEETHKDSGCDAKTCSRECQGLLAASLGCTVRGATPQRVDSLEEMLWELEATLSEMGTIPTTGPPGSPTPPSPGPQSGGGSVPPMKVVTPGASRLKAAQGQAGSPDKSKHGKQRAEYMRIQAQQQATKPSKEMSGSNETSSPVSEKPSASRTSIPVLTSFGARNSSISF